MRLNETEEIQFQQYADEVLAEEAVWQLDDYHQHGQTTRLEHCMAVAYYSFWFYKRLGFSGQEKSLVRGALLHDFFLYDWRRKEERPYLHGMVHPSLAYHEALKYFELDDLEREIIQKHMWPMTLIPPRHRCAMIVSLMDKLCATTETCHLRYRICLAPMKMGRELAPVGFSYRLHWVMQKVRGQAAS